MWSISNRLRYTPFICTIMELKPYQKYVFDAGEQVLLVAGGWEMPEMIFLDSVEILTLGNSAWEFTTPLPRAISNMGSVTLDNKVK